MSSATLRNAPRRRRHRRGVWGVYVALTLLAMFSLGPIVIFVFTAFKTQADLAAHPLAPPHVWQWSNITTAWQQANMAAGFRNTFILMTGTTVAVCLVSALAAYAMARLRPPGEGAFLVYLLVISALPFQFFLVPLFYLWTRAGLYDTAAGLILIYVGIFSPFATLLLRSFLLALPPEYEEAARVDGAGELRILFRVVLPQAWPALLTVAFVSALATYNEFLFAVTFIQNPDRAPVGLALYSFRQGYLQDQTLVAAAGLIMLVPVLVLFVTFQRRFTAGLSSSGLVG